MGRSSIRENKTIYQLAREEIGYSRKDACDSIKTITEDRLEKIEYELSDPHPQEILWMSDAYRKPQLCNEYCATICPIGKKYVPEIKMKDLSQIVLEMLASLNSIQKRQERLIEITVDGRIVGDEMEDFIRIQNDLESISVTVDALRLWAEHMMATEAIDKKEYEACKSKMQNP